MTNVLVRLVGSVITFLVFWVGCSVIGVLFAPIELQFIVCWVGFATGILSMFYWFDLL